MSKIKKAWKKWTKAEERELKKLCKEVRSWAELKSRAAESKLLKERKYRDDIRRNARRLAPDQIKYFIDKRRTISEEEEIKVKQFIFPEEEKIVPVHTFRISKKAWGKSDTEVNIISRIDYGSEGFRAGLVELSFREAAKQGFRFNGLPGGLVDKIALKLALKEKLDETNERLRGMRLSAEEKREEREKVKNDFYLECAKDLARLIPRIRKPSGDFVKLYIRISPAFDGKIGDEIAKRLTGLRKDDDIIYWVGRFDLPHLVKYVDKRVLLAVPRKRVWMRTDYSSTSVERVLKDLQKLSSRLPDMYAVGCFGASLMRPKGESRRAWISASALHNLLDIRTAENQVGMRAITFHKNDEFSVKSYSFRDLLREERKLIKTPPSASKLQKAIIELLRDNPGDPMSGGMIEYFLKEQPFWKDVTREKIFQEIKDLKRFRVGIEYNETENLYDFTPEWFQRKAIYTLPSEEELIEDCFVGFACMHASAPQTHYRFIVDEIPKYILRKGAKYLLVPGDLTVGMSHRLIERKQVYRGLIDTEQEMLAAGLVGTVIAKVFEPRFKEAIHDQGGYDLTQDELRKIISDALLILIYIVGNHDDWKAGRGFKPLLVFKDKLINFVVKEIKRVLKEQGIRFNGVHNIVESKIIEDTPVEKIYYTTPSGLSVKIGHPFTARTLTASIPSEKFLAMYLGAHINFNANWHVALSIEHYDQEIGQRVLVQLPTIQRYTDFENKKMKKIDFGIGFCRVKSHRGRVIISETGFYGEKGDPEVVDNDVIDEMLVKVGVPLQ